MTDREMLLLAYGAICALISEVPNLQAVGELIENHLYPVAQNNVKPLAPYSLNPPTNGSEL